LFVGGEDEEDKRPPSLRSGTSLKEKKVKKKFLNKRKERKLLLFLTDALFSFI
jgi:hypothetical protein